MFCPYCGAELPDDDDGIGFCYRCGRKLPRTVQEETQQQPEISPRSELLFPAISLGFGIVSILCALFLTRFAFIGFFGAAVGCFQVSGRHRYRWMTILGIGLSALAAIIFLWRVMAG